MSECFPNFGTAVVHGISFDRTGIGSCSRSDHPCAFWVLMKPSVFLSLASPLPVPRDSIDWIRERVLEGSVLSPSELRLRDCRRLGPAVSAHEGRHRMTVLREFVGDVPFPVRISVVGEFEEPSVGLMGRMRGGMRRQRVGNWVPGPLFDDCEVDLGAGIVFGVPPPAPDYGDQSLLRSERIHSFYRTFLGVLQVRKSELSRDVGIEVCRTCLNIR